MKKNVKSRPYAIGLAIGIILLILSGAATYLLYEDIPTASLQAGAGAVLAVYCFVLRKRRAKDIGEYSKLVSDGAATPTNDAITGFPLATVILRIDGRILWYNDLFSEMTDHKDLYEAAIGNIIPDLKWAEILKSSGNIDLSANYRDRAYKVMGSIVQSKSNVDDKGRPVYSVILYFLDRTETETLKKKYENEKTDVAIINIDNFDDIFQKMDDEVYRDVVSAIGKCIGSWVSESKGVLKKTERDRYLVLFEHGYLSGYIRRKFDLLAKIRAVGDNIKIPISASIGVGTGGHLAENESYARAAMEMALGRGGDQAAVKDETQYSFFGGSTKDYEKSTRVKTRAFAVALKDFIGHSDNVVFMGHSNADYDCFGAAIGLQRIVRASEKIPYIVFDNSPAVRLLSEEVKKNPEYEGMLVAPAAAAELVTPETLLVILDTHRPSMLPCAELLKKANKVVLIDHHRRSTEFPENLSLTYHEPYASSTCEMATEILQYTDDRRAMTSFEAMALYVGILMDTKHFLTKTGVRTFEAASYLKRYGLDTSYVKRLFNIDKDEYMCKLDIVKTTEIYEKEFAVAECRAQNSNIRVVSSMAADDMLNISGIKAAFVIYRTDNEVFISARSLGEVNVQLIMEKLGGGGHMTVAGAQLKNTDITKTKYCLKEAIDKYVKEK